MWIVIIAVAVFCLALTVPCLVLSDFVSKNKNKGLKRINAVKYSSFVLLLAVLLTYLVVVVCIPDLTNMPIRNFVTSLLCSVPIMFLFFGVFSSLTGGIARKMQHEKHAGREQKERQNRPPQNSKNECSHLRSLLHTYARPLCLIGLAGNQIGRASCRERV